MNIEPAMCNGHLPYLWGQCSREGRGGWGGWGVWMQGVGGQSSIMSRREEGLNISF